VGKRKRAIKKGSLNLAGDLNRGLLEEVIEILALGMCKKKKAFRIISAGFWKEGNHRELRHLLLAGKKVCYCRTWKKKHGKKAKIEFIVFGSTREMDSPRGCAASRLLLSEGGVLEKTSHRILGRKREVDSREKRVNIARTKDIKGKKEERGANGGKKTRR